MSWSRAGGRTIPELPRRAPLRPTMLGLPKARQPPHPATRCAAEAVLDPGMALRAMSSGAVSGACLDQCWLMPLLLLLLTCCIAA